MDLIEQTPKQPSHAISSVNGGQGLVVNMMWSAADVQITQTRASIIILHARRRVDSWLIAAQKSAVSAPWHNFQFCPSLQQILATPLNRWVVLYLLDQPVGLNCCPPTRMPMADIAKVHHTTFYCKLAFIREWCLFQTWRLLEQGPQKIAELNREQCFWDPALIRSFTVFSVKKTMAYRFEPRKKVNHDVKMDVAENHPDPVDQHTATRRESSCWCLCGRCVVMPSEMECVCCREFDQVNAMLADESVQCITLHPRFAAVCLEREVLNAVLVLMHDMQSSILEEPVSNRYCIV